MSRRRGPASRRGSSGGQGRYARLAARVEETREKTLTYFAPPQAPRNNVKSANMLERFNATINRRPRAVRSFPSAAVPS
ncbi:MAG: transposase, partial [Methylocella sp.]